MASIPRGSGSSTGGGAGSLPPKKRNKTDDTNNSSNPEESNQGSLHCDEPGSISSVKRVQTDHLKCTACMEYPRLEVYQCINGHLVCDACIAKIFRCPVCRVIYTQTKLRNRVAETDLDDMTYNCSYRNYGCLVTNIPRNRRNAHDIQCDHNPIAISIKFCGLLDSKKGCQFRICPSSIMQDPQHAKDVIEHLTSDPHNLSHQKVKIGEKISMRFGLPASVSELYFQPTRLFEVYDGLTYKTIGYYMLIRRVSTPRRKILSWVVVGLNSVPEDLNGGNLNSGKVTVKFALHPKIEPEKVAKDGDECVSIQSWTIKSISLNGWKDFMKMPNDQRPLSSFSLPLAFLAEFYVQQDQMCEMDVSFGPVVVVD